MKNLNPLILLFAILALGACHSNQAPVNTSVNNTDYPSGQTQTQLKTNNKQDTTIHLKIDAKFIHFLETRLKTYSIYGGGEVLPQPKHWSDEMSFFGVYKFSESVTGIGLDFNDDIHTYYASLYRKTNIYSPACSDISILLHNDTLRDVFFNNDTTRYFYVYCTKGLTTAKIIDVYFNEGPCCGFIAIQFSNIDTVRYGKPIIASKRKINLTYSVDKEFQHDLNIFDSIDEFQDGLNTLDSISLANWDHPQVELSCQFASNDSLFFTYNDRSRTVYKHTKKVATTYWGNIIYTMAAECD